MDARAAEIERQAEHAIYSDDHDACDRLRERIATLEAQREQMKAKNAAFRVSHKTELKALTSAYQRDLAMPHQGFELTNLSGNINRQKKRLAELERAKPWRHGVRPHEHACAVCGQKPAAYPQTTADEDRDPVAAMAEAIDAAERKAPPLADVPFSLTPVIGRAGAKQSGLF